MSLAILFHFLCAQHVSDINISIIGSLRLCCWIPHRSFCSQFVVCWRFGAAGFGWCSSHRAHNCRNAVASRGITRVLPRHFVLSTACHMTLFHFISLCPISNLAALLHLWWRNVTARSHKVQLLYRVRPVRGDSLWSYPIVKITAFWDSTPSLMKECLPRFDRSCWSHLHTLLGTAWHRWLTVWRLTTHIWVVPHR